MRWSLVFVAQALIFSALSHAFSASDPELLARARGVLNVGSKTYRKSSEQHHYAYKVDANAESVKRVRISGAARKAVGKAAIMVPKTDADHILEKQLVTKHLAKHGPAGQKTLGSLPKGAQDAVRKIVNAPGNLAPIPAGINRSKGQKVKNGIAGNANRQNKLTQNYMAVTYPTARRVAKQIDKVYKDNGVKTSQSVAKTLKQTYQAAGILKKGQKSPASSRGPTPPGSPPRPAPAGGKRARDSPGKAGPATNRPRRASTSSSGSSKAGPSQKRK